MKIKKRNYLTFYEDHLEKGLYPYLEQPDVGTGLCTAFYCYFEGYSDLMAGPIPFEEDELINLFRPYEAEILTPWWGSGSDNPMRGEFNDVRQNIVLLLAAMNNQL
jgi:hypothetical protein